MKIKKGDKVQVLSGKDKGRKGEIIHSFPKKQKVLVKGLNIYKKHIKAQSDQPGGIIEIEKPLHISKVQLICPNCQKKTRISYQLDKTNKKFRVCKKCKSIIDKQINKN